MHAFRCMILVWCLLSLSGCGEKERQQQPQPLPAVAPAVDQSIRLSVMVNGKTRMPKQWTLCGTPSKAYPQWPDKQACNRLLDQPELLRQFGSETRDLRPIERYAITVVADDERLDFPLMGSSTRHARWVAIRNILGAEWKKAIEEFEDPGSLAL